jgi:hypothetical protein
VRLRPDVERDRPRHEAGVDDYGLSRPEAPPSRPDRPRPVERDLHEELSFHIEREARKLIDQGMPPDEARANARARFGSTTIAADACRDERGTAFVDHTIRDVRFAPIAYAASVLVIVAACLLAASIPARRAARLDPMQTLRQE